MKLVHLTASTLFGGPERQMLGLARHLPAEVSTTFISFAEGGRCAAFLDEVRSHGFTGIALQHDTPRLRTATRELTSLLHDADILLCHGYKANLLGRIAARRVGIPAIAVSRGWTGENRKVRLYEALDRRHLRFMDRVIAVSDGQAAKVRRAGVKDVTVIRNAARLAPSKPNPEDRRALEAMVPSCEKIILAAGRLSPEKGFDVLVEAAARVPNAGFILFGEGTERPRLEGMIRSLKLEDRFKLAGFTGNLDSYLPWADLVVLPSHTEGLPNVALEASAAGVPVVATAVGGTPEVIADGETGFLVPPGNAIALAEKINELLADDSLRKQFGEAGRKRMRELFTFEAQAKQYLALFDSLGVQRRRAA